MSARRNKPTVDELMRQKAQQVSQDRYRSLPSTFEADVTPRHSDSTIGPTQRLTQSFRTFGVSSNYQSARQGSTRPALSRLRSADSEAYKLSADPTRPLRKQSRRLSRETGEDDFAFAENRASRPQFTAREQSLTLNPTYNTPKSITKASKDVVDDEDPESYPFTNLKDRTCQAFVNIPVSEFKDRADFLERNSHLMHKDAVDTVMTHFLKQAIDFSRMGKSLPSVACVLCLALIRVSKDSGSQTHFFQRLPDQNSPERKAYNDMVKAIQKIVEQQAEKEGPLLLPQPRRSLNPPQQTFQVQDEADDVSNMSTFEISNAVGPVIRPENTIQISDQPPIPDELGGKYKVRQNGRQFFCPGRVFAVLWHEGSARKVATEDLMRPRDADRTLSRGPYNQPIYSHFRRMVVVKNKRASCWCISIGTYGGQGLCKSGLQRDDINAHAIIHDSTKAPTRLRGEPSSNKRAIRVHMAKGETLDVASRVHLGKPYNVEFNLKVMDVGMVHPQDLDVLIAYVKMELGLEN